MTVLIHVCKWGLLFSTQTHRVHLSIVEEREVEQMQCSCISLVTYHVTYIIWHPEEHGLWSVIVSLLSCSLYRSQLQGALDASRHSVAFLQVDLP